MLIGLSPTTTESTGGLAALASSTRAFVAEEFDYVITAGGMAGLMLAGRLSERVRVGRRCARSGRVYAARRGPRRLYHQLQPVFGDPSYDWKLKSVPQEGLY